MRNGSHGIFSRTLISTLLHHVERWRRTANMSRQTAAAMIVEAHERIGAPVLTGIEFDPPTRDAYKRIAVNCDRVYRWLDDATKENNLLPANMIPSVLAALPVQDRLHAIHGLLRPFDLAAVGIERGDAETPTPAHLKELLRETTEAATAFAGLLEKTSDADLAEARRQLAESIEVSRHHLRMVDGIIDTRREQGAAP